MNDRKNGGAIGAFFLHDPMNQFIAAGLTIHVDDVISDIFIGRVGLGYPNPIFAQIGNGCYSGGIVFGNHKRQTVVKIKVIIFL